MNRLSKKFVASLKLHGEPIYRLGFRFGFTPSEIYKLVAGIQQAKPDDKRLIKLSKHLSCPKDQIFEDGKDAKEAKC